MPSHRARLRRSRGERDAFFRDLRALRVRRGLDLSEIAERTRFPLDMLAAAETGPELPSLPALSAYLRGCFEPLTSWEARWRRLASGTVPAGDDLPVRDAGTSPLASAGVAVARAGVPAQPAYVSKRLGHQRTRRRHVALRLAAGAAVVLLAADGAVLLAANQIPDHRAPAITPSPTPARHVRATSPPSVRLVPAPRIQPRAPGTRCPQDQNDDVVLSNAPTGPR
jgi:hypothetical protein